MPRPFILALPDVVCCCYGVDEGDDDGDGMAHKNSIYLDAFQKEISLCLDNS